MRQSPGAMQTLPVLGAAPNNGDSSGLDMGTFVGEGKVWKYNIWYQVTGGTSVDLQLWVRRLEDQVWAQVVQGGQPTPLATGAVPGRYVALAENLGVFDQVALVEANNVGTTVTAQIEEYIENNFMRGD